MLLYDENSKYVYYQTGWFEDFNTSTATKKCIRKCRLLKPSAEYKCLRQCLISAYGNTVWTQTRLLIEKQFDLFATETFEPVHEISNNVVCKTRKASDQPAHTRSLIRAFASRSSIL